MIMRAGADVGLKLNTSKCELITHPGCCVSNPTLLSFLQIPVIEAELLGAPLFTGTTLDAAWSHRCDDLARAIQRLTSIGAQDALILLRAPRVQHLFRCSPSVDSPALQLFDELLRSAVRRITNSALSDIQWLQASLLITLGGLGVKRVTSLAIPAYLAFAASTLTLQDHILALCPCPCVNYDRPAAIKLSFPATTRARSAVGPSLSLAQRSGTHCQTSSATHRYRLTVSIASLKHSCLQTRSSLHSALEIFLLMRYINLRLLTYLLTSFEDYLVHLARQLSHGQVSSLSGTDRDCTAGQLRAT